MQVIVVLMPSEVTVAQFVPTMILALIMQQRLLVLHGGLLYNSAFQQRSQFPLLHNDTYHADYPLLTQCGRYGLGP